MKNFIFKSNESDLQKMFQQIETTQKNVLYLTYQSDKILKMLKDNATDKGLQTQVDEYFASDNSDSNEDSEESIPDTA